MYLLAAQDVTAAICQITGGTSVLVRLSVLGTPYGEAYVSIFGFELFIGILFISEL
jgi:hypothetical protein